MIWSATAIEHQQAVSLIEAARGPHGLKNETIFTDVQFEFVARLKVKGFAGLLRYNKASELVDLDRGIHDYQFTIRVWQAEALPSDERVFVLPALCRQRDAGRNPPEHRRIGLRDRP